MDISRIDQNPFKCLKCDLTLMHIRNQQYNYMVPQDYNYMIGDENGKNNDDYGLLLYNRDC